jgi:iron complex transport system ATP-binding protein
MMRQSTRLSVKNVAFGYGAGLVLDGVAFDVTAGERIAIVGANGAGKTTLLKLMANLLRPTAGTVSLDDRDLRELPRRELARSLGLVPQELIVPFTFTARELVECGRTAYLSFFGGVGAADRQAVDHAMAATETTALGDRALCELSGGERQRVVIAMALAQEPAILLLDEPTQHLDLTRQGEILDLLVALSRQRRLSIVATMHDLNLAAGYFDRLIVLARGSVLADGPPDRVMRSEILEVAYGGKLDLVLTPTRHVPIVLPARRDAVLRKVML